MLGSLLDLYDKKIVAMYNGVAEIQRQVNFVVRVANLSDDVVILLKTKGCDLLSQIPLVKFWQSNLKGNTPEVQPQTQ